MPESFEEEFRRLVGEAVAGPTKIPHEWRENGARLIFPRQEDSGFDIEIAVANEEITVSALGAHEHFDLKDASPAEQSRRVLGLVRDLLSPDMRIREARSGNTPFRWTMESRSGDVWQSEATVVLFFFNYFGRRSERIYQNRQLPGRMGAG